LENSKKLLDGKFHEEEEEEEDVPIRGGKAGEMYAAGNADY